MEYKFTYTIDADTVVDLLKNKLEDYGIEYEEEDLKERAVDFLEDLTSGGDWGLWEIVNDQIEEKLDGVVDDIEYERG